MLCSANESRYISDALQAGASQFEASAGKLKRKYWWKNCKVGRIAVVFVVCDLGYILITYAPHIIDLMDNF